MADRTRTEGDSTHDPGSQDRTFPLRPVAMAKITVTCPKCGAQYSIEDTHVGKTGQCKKCSTNFVLGEAAEADLETRVLAPGEREAVRQSAPHPEAESQAAETWNVGDVILDVYEVKRIGGRGGRTKHYAEGGMGFVYRVHHRGWDLDLAVKSPKRECFETEQGKRLEWDRGREERYGGFTCAHRGYYKVVQ